jgi:hypothetical protein
MCRHGTRTCSRHDLQPIRTTQRTTMTMQHLAVQPPSRSDPTVGITVLVMSCRPSLHVGPSVKVDRSPHQPAQLQIHRSSSSTCRVFHSFVGGGCWHAGKCPVCLCCVAEPNCIDGWQAATCYSPALACPAPLSLHCHRLSPLLGALQMFPEKTA